MRIAVLVGKDSDGHNAILRLTSSQRGPQIPVSLHLMGMGVKTVGDDVTSQIVQLNSEGGLLS